MSTRENAVWRKSSYSGGEHGGCVELATLLDTVGIRDSKNPDLGHLRISRQHLAALLAEIRSGHHDL